MEIKIRLPILRPQRSSMHSPSSSPASALSTDTEWTVDRAVQLLRDTNARTLVFVEAGIAGKGWVDGPAFREQWGERALRGPSQTITKAINKRR